MKNRPFRERLGFAWAGLRECWRAEASFRTHIVLGSAAIVALIVAVLLLWKPGDEL